MSIVFLSVDSGWFLRDSETDVLLPASSVVIYTTQGESEQSVHTELSYREKAHRTCQNVLIQSKISSGSVGYLVQEAGSKTDESWDSPDQM